MKTYRYVKLDPTGNITCLVLDHADPETERKLTRKLLKECEQVAFLEKPVIPGAAAAVRMMGGEFCGNAAMAAAAWLVREKPESDDPASFLLEMSGAEKPVPCTVRKTGDLFEGTVEMPAIQEIRQEYFFGVPMVLVRMEGIVHLIYEGEPLTDEDAEVLLRRIAELLPDEAAGLLQWNREGQYMLPLVYVRGSGSMVREHGCGSGSAAVGAAEAIRAGSTTITRVTQPGGVIHAAAEVGKGRILSVKITGLVHLGEEAVIEIP